MSRRSDHRGALLTGLMLFGQAQQLGLLAQDGAGNRRFPVTIGLALSAFAMYFYLGDIQRALPFLPLDESRAAIVPALIVHDLTAHWPRLWMAALHHGSQIHLYYNLASLMWKGSQLEGRFGSRRFALLCFGLTGVSHLLMVVLSWLLHQSDLTRAWSQYRNPAVGMSALLFALKVIVNHDAAPGQHSVLAYGLLSVPTRWAVWAELALVQLLMPDTSLVGHIGGVLAGMLYLSQFGRAGAGDGLGAALAAIVAPLAWIKHMMMGRGAGAGAGAGAGRPHGRFHHDPHGHVLGSRSAASAAAAAVPPAVPFSGLRNRLGAAPAAAAPAAAAAAAPAADPFVFDDDEVQIVAPRPSAPPLANSPSPPSAAAGRAHSPGRGAAAAAPSADSSAPRYFESEMAQLYAMGFRDRRANLAALRATNGHILTAIDRLV